MKYKNILKIKDRKRFLKELEDSKRQNFVDNMKFVEWHALWIKRTSNKEWGKKQKIIIDEIYKSNRHMQLKQAN
jgi:IS5 family transposase